MREFIAILVMFALLCFFVADKLAAGFSDECRAQGGIPFMPEGEKICLNKNAVIAVRK